MHEYLKDLSVYFKGDYHKIRKALQDGFIAPKSNVDVKYIVKGDKNYPLSLYQLKKPPFVLFYEGDIHILNTFMVSVVGSRNPSFYALNQTSLLIKSLREKYTIVSGLAKGIDACAHENALDFKTVAVLGCGIDVVYPKENSELFTKMKQNQCIISEYPPGVSPRKYYFPFRNRIIAALGSKLYVMSASERSGTLTTVNEALTLNKHILVLPHPLDLKSGLGCNRLIQEGADILTKIPKL